jgi:hypothetical protein
MATHLSSSVARSAAQSSALIAVAAKELEQHLATDLAGALVTYIESQVEQLGQGTGAERQQRLQRRLQAIPQMNADQVASVSKYLCAQVDPEDPARIHYMLEQLLIARARVLSSLRDGNDAHGELNVSVPTQDVFLHRVLTVLAHAMRDVVGLYVLDAKALSEERATSLHKRKNAQLQLARRAVTAAVHSMQRPESILQQVQTASQPHGLSTAGLVPSGAKPAAPAKAPSLHDARSVRSAAPSKKSVRAVPVAAPAPEEPVMEEEEEETDAHNDAGGGGEPVSAPVVGQSSGATPLLPLHQPPGPVQLVPTTSAKAASAKAAAAAPVKKRPSRSFDTMSVVSAQQ